MDMEITFPGGMRVDAAYGGFTVKTDQSVRGGGEGSAPSPFTTFLASIGTCAGVFVLGFLKQRGLPTEGVRLIQHMERNPFSGMIESIHLEVQLPPTIPGKYHAAIVRSAELCAVKKHFANPPEVHVEALEVVAS